MVITDVKVRRLTSAYTEPMQVYSDTCIVNATDIYPGFCRHASAARVTITPTRNESGQLTITQDFLVVETDAGITGTVGPITFPGITYYLLNSVKYTLLGQDPMRTEYLHDILYRVALDQGAGDMTRAISHADAALWDIKARALGVPLYQLLGGRVQDRVAVYANTASLPHTREVFGEILLEQKRQKARGVKVYSQFGPAQGKKGIEQTYETLKFARETLGDDIFLSLEAVCCWDYDYTMQLAKKLEPLDIAWLEEPCLPDRMDEYARLKRNCPISISAGEHSAGRWSFRQMFKMDAADIYQPEPMWMGGVTEAMNTISLASAFNVKIYLHSCIPNIGAHIMAASSPAACPMTEYLLTINTASQFFLKYPSLPEEGTIGVPEAPGVGCDIDESKIGSETVLTQMP